MIRPRPSRPMRASTPGSDHADTSGLASGPTGGAARISMIPFVATPSPSNVGPLSVNDPAALNTPAAGEAAGRVCAATAPGAAHIHTAAAIICRPLAVRRAVARIIRDPALWRSATLGGLVP